MAPYMNQSRNEARKGGWREGISLVQQFSQHLLSCPGLCVLERAGGERPGSGLEEATHWRKRQEGKKITQHLVECSH